jgi:hypothetical protein
MLEFSGCGVSPCASWRLEFEHVTAISANVLEKEGAIAPVVRPLKISGSILVSQKLPIIHQKPHHHQRNPPSTLSSSTSPPAVDGSSTSRCPRAPATLSRPTLTPPRRTNPPRRRNVTQPNRRRSGAPTDGRHADRHTGRARTQQHRQHRQQAAAQSPLYALRRDGLHAWCRSEARGQERSNLGKMQLRHVRNRF